MIRLGFILGFLLGGGVASLLAQSQAEDAELAAGEQTGNPVVAGFKRQLREARQAATEAQLEKEAEMLRLRDDMIHRRETPDK
jgi:hypothetical protein